MGLLSVLSPFVGLIFTLSYCGRVWNFSSSKQLIALCLFILSVLAAALWDNSINVWLNASDALVAVGLSCTLFVLILKHRFDFNQALSLMLMYLLGYVFFRNLMFAPTLKVISLQMGPLLDTYIQRFPALRLNEDVVPVIQRIMVDYQTAVWGIMHISAVFFGVLLFNRTSSLRQPVSRIKFPDCFVYLMILSAVLTLYSETRLQGLNLLICMSMIYLIQGVGVLSHFWGNYFAKTKMLRTLLIMVVILNYPVLVLIALTGLLDIWFNFRKLNIMEDMK